MKAYIRALIGWIALMLTARAGFAQDSLSTARDLYSAAAYEDALVVLDHLAAGETQTPDRFAIHQYQAFCLLALGRTADAERAIEAVVSDKPMYHPSDTEASPRLRSAFATVRQRMLPGIIQQKYTLAKGAFDVKNFAAAESGFGEVLQALGDPDLGDASNRPPLSDLRTLATGFRDLSRDVLARAAAEAAAAEAKAQAAREAAALKAPPAAPPAAALKQIYSMADTDVRPPVTIRQELPPFPRNLGTMGEGTLDILIDENGTVQSATMRSSTNPRYDAMAIAATKQWRYRPATVNGMPVKFRKLITITLAPGD